MPHTDTILRDTIDAIDIILRTLFLNRDVAPLVLTPDTLTIYIYI